MRILYLSYDGILEPLGQSQVLRYLERLAREHEIVLISFEKPDDWRQGEQREALRQRISTAGIVWIPLRYHKTPSAPATAFDIAQGIAVGAWAVLRHRVRIVHARSYTATGRMTVFRSNRRSWPLCAATVRPRGQRWARWITGASPAIRGTSSSAGRCISSRICRRGT